MSIADYFIHTSAGRISLRDSGAGGMPVLLLHGSATSKEAFARQFATEAAEVFRMIAIDLPGHGASDDAADPGLVYHPKGLADVVRQVISALDVERVALFGWSLGGHVAIELMARDARVVGTMLTGTPPVAPGPLASLRGFQLTRDVLLASREHFSLRDATRYVRICYGENAPPAFLDAALRADGRLRPIFVRALMAGHGVDQRRAVEHAAVPVAMVNGANDPVVRLNYIGGLHYSGLWGGRQFLVPDGGHSPFWQAASSFNPIFHRFLRDISFQSRRGDHTDRVRRA